MGKKISMGSRQILQIVIILLLTSKVISKTVLRKHPKRESWQTISLVCKIDFDDEVRFFAADAFRVCNERSCPMVGEPGPFGDKCRSCCQNKKNETASVDTNQKKPGIF